MKNLPTIIILTLGVFLQTCKDSATNPSQWPVQLNVQDVGVTDACLHVQVPSLRGRLTIERDGAMVFNITAAPLDTFVIDDALLPKHTYSYKAKLATSDYLYATPEVVATTMDTTSHDIVWQIDSVDSHLGFLTGIAIFSDSGACAVGRLYRRDSLGSIDPVLYNVVELHPIL